MKLEIIGDRAALTNDDGKAVINVQGECCTVNGIRDTLEGINDAAKVIEKIKRIQSLLADSPGSDGDDAQESDEPIVGATYSDGYACYRYDGDNVFTRDDGVALIFTKAAFLALTLVNPKQ